MSDAPPDPAGAAEREVGQFIYRRIEVLMDAKAGTPDGFELSYLAQIVADVEEYDADGSEPREPFAVNLGEARPVEHAWIVGPARVPDKPRLDPPIAPMEIDAGRKLADWLRDRGDTNYAALVDRLVSGLVDALAPPGDAA